MSYRLGARWALQLDKGANTLRKVIPQEIREIIQMCMQPFSADISVPEDINQSKVRFFRLQTAQMQWISVTLCCNLFFFFRRRKAMGTNSA